MSLGLSLRQEMQVASDLGPVSLPTPDVLLVSKMAV